MDDLQTGTAAYMDLYPETSTDGGIRLGNVVPDFAAETTHGTWTSFHEWKKGKWAILFSHPADFTPGTCVQRRRTLSAVGLLNTNLTWTLHALASLFPYATHKLAFNQPRSSDRTLLLCAVCTTEIGRLALKYEELASMDCLVATLSVDPVKSHNEWINDVVAHCENKIDIKFPIIGDADRSISTAYGMIDPGNSDEQDLPLTIRAVFIINPENKLMLSLNYPACVGRNMDEIVRCVKALQLSYEKSIATPANWPNNHAELKLPDGSRTSDFKGSVFLLPTVSPEEAAERYPNHHTCDVPSKIPYLRLVKAEEVQ